MAVACGTAGAPVMVVDLLRESGRAEKRPPDGFAVQTYTAAGVARPSVVAPVPSRLTWRGPLPRRGELRAFLSLDTADPSAVVRLRVGVSDDRIYEALDEWTLSAASPAWTGMRTTLAAYAGFQWSLFYRPDRIRWHVVLAADPVAGGPARAVWGSPEIVTDATAAREYVARRHAMR